ncbi:MAG: hypothetical protein QRY16_12555 [Enterobacterales bacterium endosymbiont of Blomia tropicalis]|uniref:hypothetical protein n=1 Tax=Mixta mediterraneensis TaxID=2758443 RepID=UPI0025A6BDEA|nr:hypothetical protein [Mixta mediterraneensis]MDL4914587.1 hypothetical protein [Mixta mediterraneensis]
MKLALLGLTLVLSASPLSLWADCLSGAEIAQNTTVTLFEQVSYANKQSSLWQIDGKNPYTRNNLFNDAGVNIASNCSLIDNVLNLDFSLYGLTWYALRPLGTFEEDDRRSRGIIEQLRLVYSLSDRIQLEVGKLNTKPGLFSLHSPSDLISHYYGGFKPTRLYEPQLRSVYSSSSWAATLSAVNREHALSLTVVPKLATIDKHYLSSGNWSANQRGNSSEAWLVRYTSHQFSDHTPEVRVLLGNSHSVALSDSFSYTPQLTFNAEVAYHAEQRWRHFSEQKQAEVERYQFPSSLYSAEDKKGVELAVGGQYTSDTFNIFALEYYFQSEGYSRSQWQKQRELLSFLNTNTGSGPLDKAFGAYKYLMSSEISNTGNKGMLQGKHYLSAWSSLRLANQATLQPYVIFNLVDKSSMAGLHFSTPLTAINDKLEAFSGVYTAQGSASSEFAFFGDAVGIYVGLKYYL